MGWISLFLLTGCSIRSTTRRATVTQWHKVILKEDPPALFLYWDIHDTDDLWNTTLGDVPALRDYRDTLRMVLGEERLERAIREEATRTLSRDELEGVEDGDRINALLVHTGTLGQIRKINLLEAEILNHQLARYPLFSHPTEFHGFIARHRGLKKVRVYVAASDTEWPPRPHVLLDQLDIDMRVGWTLDYHLHNHYCKADKDYLGILAPSLADAQYYKMLAGEFQVKKALITNGYHTVVIDQSEFAKFESH